MASSLICEFMNANGEKQSITFANADPASSKTSVKQLLSSLITNSSALLKVSLTSAVSATIRTVTDTPVDIS